MSIDHLLAKFQAILEKQLPGAKVSAQVLSKAPPLKLVLIDPSFDDSSLTQETKNTLMDDPPYWIFCWASGHAMAELLLNGKIDVAGKTVLDFGSGGGACAIAAKLAGAAKVYACDIDPVGNAVCRLNAELNNVEIEIIEDCAQAQQVDLLIAADVLYERANYPFLEMFLSVAPDILVADSRLKQMPNGSYKKWTTIETTSFPDFNEALEFNYVNFYRNER